MDAFISRKRRRLSPEPAHTAEHSIGDDGEDSTDFKLAVLASLYPNQNQEVLLDYLLACGSIEQTKIALSSCTAYDPPRKRSSGPGHQSSLQGFTGSTGDAVATSIKTLTKKGKTVHLYSPADVEKHTPCTLVLNFLPTEQADALTKELLSEAPAFTKEVFQMFERTVASPHSMRFYVDSIEDVHQQKKDYFYNGSTIADVACTTPEMLKVSGVVRDAVNKEINRRTLDFYPGQGKLKFQSPDEWVPNASCVNCYDGPRESVGYHSDQLTYLGPRAVIGSVSLGVSREFRVRRILPQGTASAADAQGQIAIHLPHNSLLVMHAEMQEEWKHSIAPAQTIEPHPLAQNKRINITYRHYKEYMHPKYTPKCKCNLPTVLRCIQKSAVKRGTYVWQCHANFTPGQAGCSYFVWAEFDEDGRPPWADGYMGNANVSNSMVPDI